MAPKAIIITPKDKEEEKLLHQLIKRMGLIGRTLSAEEMEDAGLALAMANVDRTKLASKERVMRKLKA
ncbi:MAG TPA: hypothetical protein PLN54_03040 [Flavobacteriales bacterium]|nr:hypothetical protein [Flavobacteriales bacterium]